MRASFGVSQDLAYRGEIENVLNAGMFVIPYHWYVPRKYKALDQAKNFLSIATHSNMPCMIDLEDYLNIVGYKGIGVNELKPWLDEVENKTGSRPFIYTSPNYIKSYLVNDTWLSEYPLIVANYQIAAPLVPKPWTPVGLAGWQFCGDTADAKYYGFQQSLGCSLQVMYDIEKYAKEWSL